MSISFDKALIVVLFVLFLAIPNCKCYAARQYSAALVQAGLPGEDTSLAPLLAAELKSAGYTVTIIDVDALCDPARLTTKSFDLLLLPDAADLPVASTKTIDAFLQSGGNIIALQAPLWQHALSRINGSWVTQDGYQRENAGKLPPHVFVNFGPDEIERWNRASNTLESPATYETIADGPAHGLRALHAVISNLQGWDNISVRGLQNPFPSGDKFIVFAAKGDPATNQLAAELAEKDGSRWIAVIPLYLEWRQYTLKPSDFHYWQSTAGRGGRGDHLRPENVTLLSLGLAFTHTSVGEGRHEFWVGPVGATSTAPDFGASLNAFDLPAIDTLSPGYKFFDIHDAASLHIRTDQAIATTGDFHIPDIKTALKSPQPRPRGAGFDKRRDWRWIPIVEARSAKGEWRGTPVTMLVHTGGPYKGGVWASMGFQGSAAYKDPEMLSLIRRVAARMQDSVYILDGGTNFYTYFEDQDIKLGMRVSNVGRDTADGLTAKVTLRDAKSGKQAVVREWPLSVKAGETVSVSDSWKPQSWPVGGFIATAEILRGRQVIDRVAHDVHVWRPRAEKNFITVKDGEFMYKGKRWRAHGVNYMPSSGIGTEDGEYFEHWIGARSYDPEVIDRDLGHIQDMGLNALSIFIYSGYTRDQNLLDILRRLEERGMHANVSLRPGTPMDFQWDGVYGIIKYYRLWENDTVFAYDLAWEPMFNTHEDRKQWDAEWEKWIIERYGSVENAERDWGCPVPRDQDGNITNPFPKQIDTDGDWRRMTAAYRRFLDTLLYEKYSAARRLVRGVDPNHLVSFRMAEAANPQYRWDGRIPYDFPYLAAAVDILSPEAYGRIGEWEKVKPGWFEREYARWAAPGKPMMWAEMGMSVWDIARMEDQPQRLDAQAKFHKAFYRMLISSGANGVFYWWYPGGFRYGENSDFGIINPDGTDRPVTKVIRDNARSFLDTPSPLKPKTWIEIDRDAHPDGVAGIYDQAKAEFWSDIDKGAVPGLKTAGTGSDSATCPLIAVGNVPCNGTNPPKYLDAAFDSIEIQDANGTWTPVANGDTVRIGRDKAVYARIRFTNLGEATLLAPVTNTADGGVWIRWACDAYSQSIPLQADVPHLESGALDLVKLSPGGFSSKTDITITFEARNRTNFGEHFKLTLEP